MKNIRKLMSWILALTLVLGLFPAQGITTKAAEAVYEKVDRVEYGEEYLIVYKPNDSNIQYALVKNGNNGLISEKVTVNNDKITSNAINEGTSLWTVNSNNIKMGNLILGADEGRSGYSVVLSNKPEESFKVNNSSNSIIFQTWSSWSSTTYFLKQNNNSWSVATKSAGTFSFYKKVDTSSSEADDPLYPDDMSGGEYPQYPNQGSVRTTKTATADNFFDNGIAQVELGVTGVPMKKGVDIVLVFDISNSMNDNNKLEDAKQAATNFVENYVFAKNEDGTPSNNRLGLVTFGSENSTNKIRYQLKNADSKNQIINTINNLTAESGTNYDYAFSAADEVLDSALKERETYVVFMTDGAPSTYNNNTASAFNFNSYKDKVLQNKLTAAVNLKNEHNSIVYTIGFDMANGSDVLSGGWQSYKFDANECKTVLQNLASDPSHYISADDSQALNKAFESIGTNIRKAGTNASVTDVIGNAYQLQTTKTDKFTTEPVIEVKRYQLDEDGNRTDSYVVIERVSFSEGGKKATSSVAGELDVDSNGSFKAEYFSYTVTGSGNDKRETFTWDIGDINNDEITLSYYVYLKGSMDGNRGDGIYPTNESAVLTYTNYLGHEAEKAFEKPVLPWGAATITYEFYLVNEQGEPVNSEGEVIPFKERVKVVSPQTKKFNWNSTTEIDASIEAKDYVPKGYTLHIPNAAFKVHAVSSGNGSIGTSGTVPEESKDSTQYGQNDPQCTSTWVAFGVLNKTTLIPDSIVLDYGKKVKIDVMENDLLQNAVLNSVAKEDALGSDYDFETESTSQLADGFKTSVDLVNGLAEVKDGMVEYTPTKYMDSIDRFLYSAMITMETEDGKEENQYKYQTVSVIPAATVYYEDNFGTTDDQDGTNGIIYSGEWKEVTEGTAGSEYQDNGTVAEDGHPYGNDSSYAENDKLSAGSAMVVSADGEQNATASFTFKGTGFDLISRTDNQSAMIAIAVQDENGAYVHRKILDLKYQSGILYQIPVYEARFEEYGTYTVTITVSNAGNGTNFYLDGIRIYNPINPAGSDANEAKDQYQADKEANAEITELRNILLDANSYKEGNANGILYVDGNDEGTSVYETQGPNNEVYLKPGNSVGFKLRVDAGMQSVQIGAKAVNGNVSLTVGSNQITEQRKTITSASDMYYDITQTLKMYTNDDGSTEGIVVITNTGDNDTILSLTNLKITYSEAGKSTFTVDENSADAIRTLARSRVVVNDDSTVEQPVEPEQPNEPTWQDKVEEVINEAKNFFDNITDRFNNWLDSIFKKG